MTTSTRVNTTSRKRADRPGELVGVRLQPKQLAALDRWIAQALPSLRRPEAVRLILAEKLGQLPDHPTVAETVYLEARRLRQEGGAE